MDVGSRHKTIRSLLQGLLLGSPSWTSTLSGILIGFGIVTIGISGCSNNLKPLAQKSAQIFAPLPSSGVGPQAFDGSSLLSDLIQKVLPNPNNPNTVIDILTKITPGQTVSQYCPGQDGSSVGSATAPTVCTCILRYATSASPSPSVSPSPSGSPSPSSLPAIRNETPVIYREGNLVRCSIADVPSTITQLNVSIYASNLGIESNSVQYLIKGAGTTTDTTNLRLFSKVTRYQCRDIISAPFLFDNNVYDPILSEDPRIAYPLNFYATNLATAINTYVTNNPQDWQCPPILNSDESLDSLSLTNFNTAFKFNKRLYSRGSLTNGNGKLIYPLPNPTPSGFIDRHTFYLARQSAGVFERAVNSYIAPNSTTSNTAPLGYAANPIPDPSGRPGIEGCPNSQNIPSGFKWAKLWLFRSSLDARTYPTSGTDKPNIGQLSTIGCHPGDWTDGSSFSSACEKTITNQSSLLAAVSQKELDPSKGRFLTDRLLFLKNGTTQENNMCVRYQKLDSSMNGTLCTGGAPGPGCEVFTPAGSSMPVSADTWTVQVPTVFGSTVPQGCDAATKVDPFGLCPAVTTPPTQPSPGVAQVANITLKPLDKIARYDFLFVVSPPDITVQKMTNPDTYPEALPYLPFRYQLEEDCLLDNPDSCLSNRLPLYGVKLHDVNSAGDPPGDNPNRAGVFPVCVLQPESK